MNMKRNRLKTADENDPESMPIIFTKGGNKHYPTVKVNIDQYSDQASEIMEDVDDKMKSAIKRQGSHKDNSMLDGQDRTYSQSFVPPN